MGIIKCTLHKKILTPKLQILICKKKKINNKLNRNYFLTHKKFPRSISISQHSSWFLKTFPVGYNYY